METRTHHHQHRPAITLIEVLISMGVLTIGILGVAALFPVGAHLAQRGEVYDRADAAAAAALNDAITRGLVDPENWVSYELPEGGGVWSNTFRNDASRRNGSFTRPFAKDLRARLASAEYRDSRLQESTKNYAVTQQAGSILFIDPVGVASAVNNALNNAAPDEARSVPASLHSNYGVSFTGAPADGQLGPRYRWSPWARTIAISRLSIGRQAAPIGAVSLATADQLTTINDDLSFELGDQADRPAQQRVLSLNAGGTTVPLQRQSERQFSYLLSVVPRTPAGRDALAYGGRGQAYDVSAVVFNRRPLNRFNAADGFDGIETLVRSERICPAAVLAGGPSGGEIRLWTQRQHAPDAFFQKDLASNLPWKDLKAGQYVMLFGSTPASRNERPMLFAQWYRVVAVNDQDNTQDNPGNPTKFLGPTLALRGPDWPWPDSTLENGLSLPREILQQYPPSDPRVQDDLRVLILDGAVGVNSRTMRLEAGTAWSE